MPGKYLLEKKKKKTVSLGTRSHKVLVNQKRYGNPLNIHNHSQNIRD